MVVIFAATGDNYTLTITNADLYDAGTYRCEARNHYQDYSDQVTIEVEGAYKKEQLRSLVIEKLTEIRFQALLFLPIAKIINSLRIAL